MVISVNQVSANASACTGVFPWTHRAVGVDILLWAKVFAAHKPVVLSLIFSSHVKSCAQWQVRVREAELGRSASLASKHH